MSVSFAVKSALRKLRWRKYWEDQDGRNHVEFYRKLAAEWRADRARS